MSQDTVLSDQTGAARRTRRGPRTRKLILDASLRLFSERGFARTTVRDIAHEAGITDAAIYYHFQSKREVLEALVEERGFVAGLQRLEQVSADMPLEETLQWMARGAVNIMDDNRDFLRLIFMEGLGGDDTALEQYRRLIDMWERSLTHVLERYAERGLLPAAAVGAMARQTIYMILMAFQDTLLGRHVSAGASPEERRQELKTFAEGAIKQLLAGTAERAAAPGS